MTTERRNADRRKEDRRKVGFFCPKCGRSLIYYIPTKPTDKETLWCEPCQQMYVIVAQHIEIPYMAMVR
jgi:uncharacterized protein YbaR (Trm112 family)